MADTIDAERFVVGNTSIYRFIRFTEVLNQYRILGHSPGRHTQLIGAVQLQRAGSKTSLVSCLSELRPHHRKQD
jgi:hypothetical protein